MAADEETLADQIQASAAENVRRVSVDGLSTETHSLADQIAADRHLANRSVSGSPFGALRQAKLKPPGTA